MINFIDCSYVLCLKEGFLKEVFLMISKYLYNDHVASECILTHKQNIGDHLTYKHDNPINPHE